MTFHNMGNPKVSKVEKGNPSEGPVARKPGNKKFSAQGNEHLRKIELWIFTP